MADRLTRSEPVAGSLRKGQRLPPLAPNASLRWDVVARLLPEQPGAVLEVGCGRGAAAARIARRAERFVCCEPDPQSFAVAKANLEGLSTVHNCMSFELPKGDRFDTICSFEVIEHIEDDTAALLEGSLIVTGERAIGPVRSRAYTELVRAVTSEPREDRANAANAWRGH